MARATHPLIASAEEALAKRLAARVPVHGKGYCERPEDNLVETVTRDMWDAAKADIEKGKGTELTSKFLAAYSSSALAVNAFAPLSGRVMLPGGFVVDGEVRFEQERSAWAPGWWPTLDVIVEDSGAPVRLFVESKCIEFLRKGATSFSAAFVKAASEHLEPEAVAVFETVFADRHAFEPLDAAQLLKHFLAAKRAATERRCAVILLCVWWEPADADAHRVFAAHNAAAVRLAAALPDPEVSVLAISYPELWAYWEAVGDLALQRHVRNRCRSHADAYASSAGLVGDRVGADSGRERGERRRRGEPSCGRLPFFANFSRLIRGFPGRCRGSSDPYATEWACALGTMVQ